MKKLLAITVIFALVAGAAFAETSFGGGGNLGTNILSGAGGETVVEKDDGGKAQWWNAGGKLNGGDFTANFSGDNAGGSLRFWPSAASGWWGNVWWKPIDALKIELQDQDGVMGHDAIAGWGFLGGARDIAAFDVYPIRGFAGGLFGLIFEITPMDALTIGIGIPVWGGYGGSGANMKDKYSTKDAEDIFLRTALDVKFALDGIGTIKVRANFGPGRNDRIGTGRIELSKPGEDAKAELDADEPTGVKLTAKKDKVDYFDVLAGYISGAPLETGFGDLSINGGKNDYTSFNLAFHLTAIENLGVELGLGLRLPAKYDYEVGGTTVATLKYNSPIDIGLGVDFNADAFGIKFGASASLGEKYTMSGSSIDAFKALLDLADESYSEWMFERKFGPRFAFWVLPSFKVNDDVTIFLQALIELESQEFENVTDKGKYEYFKATQFSWKINPYVQLNLSGATFWAGFKIEDDGKLKQGAAGTGKMDEVRKVNTMKWAVPIGFTFGF